MAGLLEATRQQWGQPSAHPQRRAACLQTLLLVKPSLAWRADVSYRSWLPSQAALSEAASIYTLAHHFSMPPPLGTVPNKGRNFP